MTDYSQSGEQEIILAHVGEAGRFLDIGAGDGQSYSNTRALVAERWWGGVAVEPAPWAFDRLSQLYADKDVRCVQAVVTAERQGLIEFHYTRDDHLSSVEAEHVAKWDQRARFHTVTAVSVRLYDLLNYFDGGFQVVSIDTEGTTMELLRAFARHPAAAAVKCLVAEAENGEQREEIRRLPGWKGSRYTYTVNNVILCR